ncbi:cupin domain-containing protein [Hyphomonas sp.]|uniref:cupin domain-containing protein n=1 Tax=Hyphomonas sp. TaxID=87 RepID=UPI0030F769A6
MSLQFFQGYFSSLSEVMDDVKRNGTWPTTFVSPPSPGLEPHWHSEEVHAYIMEGETDFLDAVSGVRTKVSAGDKVVVPARTLHAEGPVKDKVVYVLALPEALGADDFLKMREPNDLK